MIVIHTGCIDGQLLVWAECSQPKKRIPSTSEGKAKTTKHQPYVYDGGLSALTAAFKEADVNFKPIKKRVMRVFGWLPTLGIHPIPSSPLIADLPVSRTKPKLSSWLVTAFPLSDRETVEFLCACMGRHTLASGVVVGKDVAFWAETLRFAGSLVARQCYLPGITFDQKHGKARWEPVFSGSDIKQLADLVKVAVPAALALSRKDHASPSKLSAVTEIKKVIGAFTDTLVRTAIHGPSGPRRKSGRKLTGFESAHDAWFHALRGIDGVISGTPEELKRLAFQIQDWRRPLSLTAGSPFRLCFRLEEPDSFKEMTNENIQVPGKPWFVRYLVQPHQDPSLLVPVEDLWRSSGPKATALKKYGGNLKEYLLSSLGQAAGISPRIASSLESAGPSGFILDTREAHQFLIEKSIDLEQAGFGVLLPAWWTRKGTKQRLSARANVVQTPKMRAGGVLSLDAVVQFEWEIALGGEKMTLRELEMLAKLKSPLVQVRGEWVQLNASEIQTAVDFWKKKSAQEATVRDLALMAIGAREPASGFEFDGVNAEGWIGRLIERLAGRSEFETLDAPKTFSGALRPYQARGYSWLSFLRTFGLGACLADDMGLGKTIQTLALIQRDWDKKASKGKRGPVLLICPTSVVNNWLKEAERFTPDLPVMVHHGVERKREDAFLKEARSHAMVISSYGLLHRDIRLFKEVPWAGVVLDEAQNIKNPETKQARAARSIHADYRIALTGTPVENHVGDLWSIMEFLNPGLLGTQSGFKRDFLVPIQVQRDALAVSRLKKMTGPFILRRLKTDRSIIDDLPEKMEMKVFCTLTKEQASLYAAVVKEAEGTLESSEGIQRKGVILAVLSKLKQVCNHPAHFLGDNSGLAGRSGKLARLLEMLEEIREAGEKALIFSQFAEMGELLKSHLQETYGEEVPFLHGGVPREKRDRMVERFQRDKDGPSVFILSLKAGGTGLNLTRANHVFHFDRWWNPAVEDQATDRAFRIGQSRDVQVHKFICAGTLEDRIDEMIERKKAIAEDVVGAGEGWLTELSNEQIMNLFTLRKEAVGD